MTLTWEEPESDGGSKITGYVIEKADVKRRNNFLTAGQCEDTTFKVDKLLEGNEYIFKVMAENAIGTSDPASIDEPITAKLPFDPPGPPRNVRISDLTASSCTLHWEKPGFDGGSAIHGYYIEKSSGYSSRWVKVNREPITNLQKAFKDLVEGSEYEYRVLAENDAGISKPSETTGVFKAKDPFDVPGQPGTPEVTKITKDTASLTWTAPQSDGGSEITNYIVEVREVGDKKWKRANKTDKVKGLKYDVSNLREGTEYEFRVTAENKAGEGKPSGSSRTVKYGRG